MLEKLSSVGLLSSPLGQGQSSSSAIIVYGRCFILFTSREELNRRVTTNPELPTNNFVLSGIHLAHFDFPFKVGSQLNPFRRQGFAVAAPWCIKLHKPGVFVAVNHLFEVVVC